MYNYYNIYNVCIIYYDITYVYIYLYTWHPASGDVAAGERTP